MRGYKHSVFVLFLLLSASVFGQKVTEEQKERANELFEKEQYVEATPLFLQILSLEPKVADWNFKYGACLLYNSGEKKKALRYLKYGVNTEGTDSRVFYFYGRALHLDYQFSKAKKQYQLYATKRPKVDKRYPVEREIRMCDNGQKLLTTFTDIIVTDKVQISETKFYDIYSSSRTIKGSITVNRDFQTKLDKKKGHIPIVHYGPDAKMIFYSSWGDDESTGKDIYQRIKLPDNSWGKPQLVRGNVNTNEDEDYPFLHSSGKFLYFSSKGHNSMGGYDIFMSRLDPNTNSFGPPENVDFAISSPDDDLFYVVDSTFTNAYFASARSSEKDMLHVYKVKVVRVPIQEVILMGNFTSDINPEDQKIKLSILKNTNGDELIKMPITAEKGGRYSYVFPQGGKYDYVVEVDGSGDEFKFTIELPFLDEFRPLKQEIIHTTENGNEIIRVINRFDESVEGAEAIIAEVIRKKSELDVNVNQFDLEAIENQQNLDGLLTELGFDNMTLREVAGQLGELQNSTANNKEITDRITSNVSSELIAKTERIKELDQMEKELRASAEKATDPVAKHKLLTEASQKQQEKEQLIKQVQGLETLIADVDELGKNAADPGQMKQVLDKFESLRNDDEEKALQYLVSEKNVINQAKSGSPNQIKDAYTKEILQARADIREADDRRTEYRNSVEKLHARIATLERQRDGAKRKEQERIDQEISDTRLDIAKREKEIERLTSLIVSKERELDATEERLASYQNALSTEEKSEVDPTEVAEAKQAVEAISTEEEFNYDTALATLETEHPEINGGDPIVDYAAEIDKKYEDDKAAIQNDPSLTPLEQASRLLENNETTLQTVDEQIEEVQQKLEEGEDERLREQEAALLEQKQALEEENADLVAEEQRLKEQTPDAALSKEDVLAEVAPNLLQELQQIEQNNNLSELERLQEEQRVRENLSASLESENNALLNTLEVNPDDEAAKAKQELVRQLIAENDSAISEVETAIAEMPTPVSVDITALDVIANVDGNYQEEKSEILSNDDTPLAQEEALLQLNEKLLEDLEKEAEDVGKELERNPEDPTLQAKDKALQEAIALTETEISENNQNIAALSTGPTPSTIVTAEEMLTEVAPNYEQDRASIQNGEGTGKEKEQALKSLEEETLADLQKEQSKWQKRADRDPENEEAKAKAEALNQSIAERQTEIATIDNRIAALDNNTTAPTTSVTAEEMLTEVAPNYEQDRASIQNGEGTDKEKAEALKALEEETLADLQKEQSKWQKRADRDPEDEEAKAKADALDQSITERQTEIAAIDNRIAALDNATPTSGSVTVEEVMAEVAPEVSNELSDIDATNDSESVKARRKASVIASVLETLEKELENVEKELDRNPEDEGLNSRKGAIESAIQEQRSILQQLQETAVEQLTAEEKEALISEVSPTYTEGATSGNVDQQIQSEKDLQAALEEEIADKEKSLNRRYSVSVAIEKAIQEKLLEESREREANLDSNTTSPASAAEFIASIREDNGQEVTNALTEEATDLESLQAQEETLAAYETYLDQKIEEQEAKVENDPTTENQETLSWLVEEKERVAKKRRSISISIGELEQVAITNPGDNQELNELNQEEQRIRDAQQAEDLSNAERKQLDRDLREVTEQRYAIENDEAKADLNEAKETTQEIQNDLTARVDSDNEIVQRTLEHAETEEQAIAEIEAEAADADSEAERNYLLNEAKKRREALNDDLNDALVTSKLAAIEEQYDIATMSRPELEKKRRSYTIQLGEITREIEGVNQEIAEAKRKDVPPLETHRSELITRKEQIEARLKRVNEQLGQVEETPTALNEGALEEEISFSEERDIAASEEYEQYQKAAVEALMIANEIRNLEQELALKRSDLQRAVQNREPDAVIQEKAAEVQALEEEMDRLEIELTQKKFTADQALPQNEDEAMKMQNLVARGIQPLKVTAVATALMQMPTTGFAIDTESERPNNGVTEIPVGVTSPQGLVYRVQVGAFARPLRPDVFKEFNPVSGEKIEGTNITRYMAGYFSSSESVVGARQQIRDLGYSDAFIVAYCNGERITFGEARRREAAGICVPKRAEEIMIEVAENTAKNLNIPVSSEPEVLPEWAYAKSPGAADSDPIEKMEGLFFTVQIGVFNRAVSDKELKNMPDISTFRLPNGQIRYNTGMFDSAEEALPRQNFARKSGVQGAFIVAYYKGKRISIGNARKLLLEYGESILQSRKELEPKIPDTPIVRSDSVRQDVIEIIPMEEWEKRVQVVTEATFDEFPRDILNRYNAEGSFYYDEKDKRVKSTIYENEDYLPNLFNFRDDVDTVYLEEGLLDDQKTETIYFVFTDSLVPGAFMDWMLRCNYRRTINRTFRGTEVRIFGVAEERMDAMIERIRLFGVEPEKILDEE